MKDLITIGLPSKGRLKDKAISFFNDRGLKIQTNGTDSHIILVNLSDSKYSGREAADKLEDNGITVNKNGIPNDPRNFLETSGFRIGTAAETTRGLKEADFKTIAHKICNLLDR